MAYVAFFLLVWLEGVGSFYYFGVTFRDGSPAPTATQTEELTNHGKVVYITPEERERIDLLQGYAFKVIPTAIALGAFLQYVVGVKLFQDAPSLKELLEKARARRPR